MELSRRTLVKGLGAAVALSSAPSVAAATSVSTSRVGARLPMVTPLSAQKVHESYGICAHPSFVDTVYQQTDAWMSRLASLGVTHFRGVFNENNPGTQQAIAAARQYGLKWVMLVAPENGSTLGSVSARMDYIAHHAADICAAIEGPNEPNHNRDGSPVAPDWAVTATRYQKLIWEKAKAHASLSSVPIIGPSLHDVMAHRSGGRDYVLLADQGILNYQDYCGLHRYPSGNEPMFRLDERLGYVYAAYGQNYPVWVTETGYHNAVSTQHGHNPSTEWVSGTYGPRAILQFAMRGIPMIRYQLLDFPDAGAMTDPEDHFGLYRANSLQPNSWRAKSEASRVQALLQALRDPGPAYTPSATSLGVRSRATDVAHVVTAKRDGSATVWLWRDSSIWDPNRRQPRSVPPVTATINDRLGSRDVRVDAQVRGVELR